MKYQYGFNIITLKNGSKVLNIKIQEDSISMVAHFLEDDIQGRDVQYVLDVIDDVLEGRSEHELMVGNLCETNIYKDKTTIENLFNENEYSEIETTELREFVVLWGEETKRFYKENR